MLRLPHEACPSISALPGRWPRASRLACVARRRRAAERTRQALAARAECVRPGAPAERHGVAARRLRSQAHVRAQRGTLARSARALPRARTRSLARVAALLARALRSP